MYYIMCVRVCLRGRFAPAEFIFCASEHGAVKETFSKQKPKTSSPRNK